MSLTIGKPILNSPFKEPKEYWIYHEGQPKRMTVMKPTGYYFCSDKRDDSWIEMLSSSSGSVWNLQV